MWGLAQPLLMLEVHTEMGAISGVQFGDHLYLRRDVLMALQLLPLKSKHKPVFQGKHCQWWTIRIEIDLIWSQLWSIQCGFFLYYLGNSSNSLVTNIVCRADKKAFVGAYHYAEEMSVINVKIDIQLLWKESTVFINSKWLMKGPIHFEVLWKKDREK